MRMCCSRVATVFATIVLALTIATAPGCLGKMARNQGVATLDLANEGINFDIQLGIQATAAVDPNFDTVTAITDFSSFNASIESGDRERIVLEAIPLWPIMRGFAEAGVAKQIADGTLSEANAIPVMGRITEFERLLLRMTERLNE